MKPWIDTLDDHSIDELRARAERVRRLLWHMRTRAARATDVKVVHEAFDRVERLLPGLLRRPASLLARAVGDLTPEERDALRRAIQAERAARERLARLLGDLAPALVEHALERADARDAVTAALRDFLRAFEHVRAEPALA